MENKYLQVKKESIFTKFVNFIKGIFGKKVDQKITPQVQSIEFKEKKSDFIKEIRLNKEENKGLLELQRKYENNEIDLSVMSDEEIHELNLLYKRQVSDLKKTLEDKKTQLDIMKRRVNTYSTNM